MQFHAPLTSLYESQPCKSYPHLYIVTMYVHTYIGCTYYTHSVIRFYMVVGWFRPEGKVNRGVPAKVNTKGISNVVWGTYETSFNIGNMPANIRS